MSWYDRFEEGALAVLLGLMTCVSFVQVVARYVFNYSFVWAFELVTVLFAWLIFLGMSYGVRAGAHIGVDMLVRRLGPLGARVAAGLGAVLCMGYALVLATGGWTYMQKMFQIGIEMQDLPIPQWVPRIVLPLGFGLLALRFLGVLVDVLRGRKATLLGDEVREALKAREG